MDIVCGICGRHFRDVGEAKNHSQEHKCSDNIPVKLTTSDNNMSKEDRDYWKAGYDEGHHPPICTCAECNEIRNQRIKEQNKIIEEINKAGGFTLEEQGNENQEYPRQEVPRWQSQGMNIPSFSPPENEYGAPQQRGGKFGSIGTIVITVIISLVLCYAMVSLLGISPSMKQYKADITRLELDLVDVRAVDTAINAELDGLQNASIIAQNASTTATQAKELVNTLQADYTSLNNALGALGTRISNLEGNSGDIYDDTIIRGLITAVEDKITAINTTITALQTYDTTNTSNLTALQTQIDDLADDLADIQGDDGDSSSILSLQTEINNIKKFLNDADTVVGSLKYQLKQITDRLDAAEANINAINGKVNTLQSQVNGLVIEKVEVYDLDKTNDKFTVKANVSGSYAIVLTLYGIGFDSDSTVSTFSITAGGVAVKSHITYAGGKMLTIILEPNQVQVGNPPQWVDVNWVAGKVFGVGLVGNGDIQYASVEIAVR